jgi:beta-glucanase (GH16 family)
LKKPLSAFTVKDPDWTKKFHVWRMDWNKDTISLFLDDQLLNSCLLNQILNPDGFNPFLQPHFLLLNLALGRNGGDPSKTSFPIKYEVDYVRVYQKK